MSSEPSPHEAGSLQQSSPVALSRVHTRASPRLAFAWVLGSDLRFSCFYSEHFTHGSSQLPWVPFAAFTFLGTVLSEEAFCRFRDDASKANDTNPLTDSGTKFAHAGDRGNHQVGRSKTQRLVMCNGSLEPWWLLMYSRMAFFQLCSCRGSLV